jgi:hypothetical protein
MMSLMSPRKVYLTGPVLLLLREENLAKAEGNVFSEALLSRQIEIHD